MKRRGWPVAILIATFLLMGVGRAVAATSTFADLGRNGVISIEESKRSIYNIQNQYAIAKNFADITGMSLKDANAVFVVASNGTALVALESALMGWDFGGIPTDPEGDFGDLLTAIQDGVAPGATSAQIAAARAAAKDFWAFEGQNAAYNSEVGNAAAKGNIKQADTRFNFLANEYETTINGFSNNTALSSIALNQNFANRFWVSPFYTYEDRDNRNGWSGWKYKSGGVSLGYDRWFGRWNVGAALTYSRGDVSEDGVNDDNTVDNYSGWLYASYRACNGFFLNMTGGYNYGDNDMRRFVTSNINRWQVGSNHTNTWWAGGKVGYNFKATSNFTIAPTVGLYYLDSKSSAFTYSGAFAGGHVNEIDYKSVLLPVEVTAKYRAQVNECSSVDLNVSGGYTYDFKNDGARGDMYYDFNPAYPIFIQGAKPGHSSWNVGAGVKYNYKHMDVGVDYRYVGQSDFKSHNLSATIGVKF